MKLKIFQHQKYKVKNSSKTKKINKEGIICISRKGNKHNVKTIH